MASNDLLSVLERIRTVEADIEQSEESIVHQQLLTLTNHRHTVLRDHFIKSRLNVVTRSVEKLLDMYLDEDDIVAAREAPDAAQAEEDAPAFLARTIQAFEAQVSTLREYHARNSDIPSASYRVDVPDPSLIANKFTVAEKFGECLDLSSAYEDYSTFMIETKKEDDSLEKRLEFVHFVGNLARIVLETPVERKLMRLELYSSFVSSLASYMQDFYSRVHPLVHLGEGSGLRDILDKVESQNAEYFTLLGNKATAVHLKKFVKLFAAWDLQAAASRNISTSKIQQVSLYEGQVPKMISSVLADAVLATDKCVSRNQSKSAEELHLDREREERLFSESLTEANAKSKVTSFTDIVAKDDLNKISELQHQQTSTSSSLFDQTSGHGLSSTTNIGVLETRLGVDGKPIDRWITVMQQLDKKFPCEVCGGTVYDGPKNFQEHFRAERHIGALAKLSVTKNLRLYEGITDIRKVIELREKLTNAGMNVRRRMREDELEEEMQDVQGNVMTARDFREFQERRRNL